MQQSLWAYGLAVEACDSHHMSLPLQETASTCHFICVTRELKEHLFGTTQREKKRVYWWSIKVNWLETKYSNRFYRRAWKYKGTPKCQTRGNDTYISDRRCMGKKTIIKFIICRTGATKEGQCAIRCKIIIYFPPRL